MKRRPYYFFWFLVILLVEFYIAIYVDDDFIRPYVGDVLVVVLIYALVKSIANISTLKVALGVLLFSFLVEILQYFKIVELLGLGSSTVAKVVIGTSFSGKDFLAYTAGFLLILVLEAITRPKLKSD